MIRINLLPADLRRGNRIPPRVLISAFGAALLVSAAVGWLGLVYFGDLSAAEATLQEVEAKLADRSRRATYYDALDTRQKDYSLRVQTIQEIGRSRRVWSRFLDDLIDVVNNNGDTERHLAWFDGITVKSDDKKGDQVSMPGAVQDADKSRLANLHEDLEAATFAADLETKSDPTFKLDIDKVRIPQASLRFPLTLQFKPAVPQGKK